MIALFNKSSLVVLESLSFTQTLYAFDFDGTLAKIVKNPPDAFMSPLTEKLLIELTRFVPVAVISGRSREDLKKRVPKQVKYCVGNHGIEGAGTADQNFNRAEVTCRRWIQLLENIKFAPGVEIENKKYSLSIHYRKCRSKALARKQIQKAIGTLAPAPHVIPGKCVYNILPTGAPHKGTAILGIIGQSRMKHAFYVGDDDTDEDVFALPYPVGQIFSVRIGKRKASQASYFIERQSDINRLLKILIGFHSAGLAKDNLVALEK